VQHAFLVVSEFGFMGFVVLPLAIGIVCAVRHLRAGSRAGFARHLGGSIAAGAVMLGLLWSSFFGDNLSKSSTAGLIFAVAPFYAAFAHVLVYGLVSHFFKRASAPKALSPLAWIPMLAPLSMLAIVLSGLIEIAQWKEPDYEVARRTTDAETMQRLMAQTRIKGQDGFMIAIRLAMNPAATPAMLTELVKHEHPAVRDTVASNPHTPLEVVAPLHYDCSSIVRRTVAERLGPAISFGPAPAFTGSCKYKNWR
jgi:hypothetical protein